MGLRNCAAIKINVKVCKKRCESRWTNKQHFGLVRIQMQEIIAHPVMDVALTSVMLQASEMSALECCVGAFF